MRLCSTVRVSFSWNLSFDSMHGAFPDSPSRVVTFYHSEPFCLRGTVQQRLHFIDTGFASAVTSSVDHPSRSITGVCFAKPSFLGITEPFLTQKTAFLSHSEPFLTQKFKSALLQYRRDLPGLCVHTLQLCVHRCTHTQPFMTKHTTIDTCSTFESSILYVLVYYRGG